MTTDLDYALGKRLRQRRWLLGLRQRDLAALCGVRFQQIQKYECAASRISAVMLFKLARALDVEVGYFFAGVADGPEGEPKSWRERPSLG